MSKIIDNICKLRDILENKTYNKLPYIRQLAQAIFEEVHRNVKRKTINYNFNLDFTSQDLRETARAISDTIKRWDNIMCPEKQIKKIIKEVKDNKINMNLFFESTIPIMRYRRDYIQILTELRSLLEYHAVFLYFLEEASQDKFALNYIERF